MLKSYKNGSQTLIFIHSFTRVFQYRAFAINTSSSTFMVDYLRNSLGFTNQQAILTASKVRSLKSTQNPNSVVDFLKNNGFTNTHVQKLVLSAPFILNSNVDRTLKPKFEFFQKIGLHGSKLADVILTGPDILRRSLDKHIIPTIDALKSVFSDNDDDNQVLIRALNVSCWMLGPGVPKNLPLNVALLKSYGLSNEQIRLLMLRKAKYLSSDHVWLQDVLIRVEEKLGIPRKSAMFFHGVSALCSATNEFVESKFEFFRSWGWTELDIIIVARKNPYVLVFSNTLLESKIHFLMNKLGYRPDQIARRGCVLTYSLDKRIIPRYIVIKVLKEKKLIKPNTCFFSCLYPTDSNFFMKYILPFEDKVPGLSEDYKQKCGFLRLENAK